MPVTKPLGRGRIVSHRRTQVGSVLIEVLVSVVLLSVSVLGLVRVLGSAVQNSGEIEYRTVAAAMADESVARMWIDRSNLAGHVVTDEALAQLPDGKRTITVNGNVVVVTISWQAPGDAAAHQHQISATITGNT
jgi:type IV pilus assembly protein PilV